MEQTTAQKIQDFIDKVDSMKKQEKMDLSSDQDLTLAIMNLVSIEEHFFFSGAKTGKTEYYDLIKNVREIRKGLLKKIVKETDQSEKWCISKHLLAASMRLMEVGTKQLGMNKKDKAYDLFGKAYNLYSLFWALNMQLINPGDLKKIDDNAINVHDKKPEGFLGKLGELVKKAINCCWE
ncbi:hypothetical protein COT20_01175 [bacterium (Candidatus Gribaldobacteria) CG08_land_8_20_14_0_20_39_15]|uniref:Uncharacterized protein n=1 Tax=bacterium (Candidatus Gribaldobacteria) CG08_land_8_20_14_0_20_39_15 TaxID=2014273 RepID=A0A2M6XUQ3_9BACT|nr:MAG: hypothetical protein COT20_01175 [bacterium (Candidatus Gribaldobacteria) CG08_land_8_20_14_0_20_39_15]